MTRWSRCRLSRRKAFAPGLGAVLALFLSACGIGADASPNLIGPKKVPFGLLRPSTPTTAPRHAGQYVTIYLEGPQRLVPEGREVVAPATVKEVLRELGSGPTSAEASRGLQSPISTASPLVLWRLGRTTVTVNVAKAFTQLAGGDQAVAMAQLVYTLTILPGIASVSIRIDGRRAEVPTGNGTLTGGPLVRSDYATVAPI